MHRCMSDDMPLYDILSRHPCFHDGRGVVRSRSPSSVDSDARTRLRSSPSIDRAAPPTAASDFDQRLHYESGLYTPGGKAPRFQLTSQEFNARMTLMRAVIDLIDAHVPDMRMDRVFISWSPDADWSGFHADNGDIYVNLATLVPTQTSYLGVIMHEVAHDTTHAHDLTWGMEMQRLFEKLLSVARFPDKHRTKRPACETPRDVVDLCAFCERKLENLQDLRYGLEEEIYKRENRKSEAERDLVCARKDADDFRGFQAQLSDMLHDSFAKTDLRYHQMLQLEDTMLQGAERSIKQAQTDMEQLRNEIDACSDEREKLIVEFELVDAQIVTLERSMMCRGLDLRFEGG